MSKGRSVEKEEGVRFSFWLEDDDQAEYRLIAFKVEEALFALTKIEVLLNLSSSLLPSANRLGKRASLSIQAEGLEAPACFSGLIVEATEFFEAGNVLTRLVLLPELARLEQEAHYRIFQRVTVPDIVETLLGEHGINNSVWQLEGEFPLRNFCMQYGESDLTFLQRILAEEAIFYYFLHAEKGRQRLVLCNNIKLLPDCPNHASLKHDSHGAHGLYDIAGAEEVYCHSLRRSFSAAAPQSGGGGDFAAGGGQNAPAPAAALSGGAVLAGIAHLPLPLCGHRLSLHCPVDKSLNALWHLIAVRHEGLNAEGSPLAHDLADYFTEDEARISLACAEKTAANPVYGRAFGPASLLPRLGRVSSTPVYEDEAANYSAFGALFHKSSAKDSAKKNTAAAQQNNNPAENKAVYACAFTAAAAAARYCPPLRRRPLIAGPQAAFIVAADKREQRYILALQIPAGGQSQKAEARFWVEADSALGAAIQTQSGLTAAEIGSSPGNEPLILEFLGGDPDRPLIMQPGPDKAAAASERVAPSPAGLAGSAGPRGAEQVFAAENFADSADNLLSDMPWSPIESGGAPPGEAMAAAPPPPLYAPPGDPALVPGGQEFIQLPPLYPPGSSPFAGGPAAMPPLGSGLAALPAGGGAAPPLAHLRADLQNSAAAGPIWPGGAAPAGDDQRQDIRGIYELNCGEKYLCRTRFLHINAGDRLVLRGPGGKIIIDKYSMTLEAPIIRLKGRLILEENAFDRQEGVRIAIRDELPLVADCHGGAPGPDKAGNG